MEDPEGSIAQIILNIYHRFHDPKLPTTESNMPDLHTSFAKLETIQLSLRQLELSQKEKQDKDVSKLAKHFARLHQANDAIQDDGSGNDSDGEMEQNLDLT